MVDRIVYVYKSPRKARTYLYTREKDVFTCVPDGLLTAFGEPKFLMMFALHKHPNLPKVTPEELEAALSDKGYYLRIDLEQEEENLLNVERRRLGLPPIDHDEIKDFFK
ncbi:MAG: YcgL domain-containing protein [Proteobacteria bacterium]|uniref:YcgL domain-containing protein n=1 Tax=Candidatus Avisuccinivibrio stercorigallinarum TaxID=2840704 RepID=A0A9D9DBI8_9GAMM|nr:YcgL domain-containing protein [Candidatus Avisuccinivibrio stercorigallinarum]